MSASRRRIPGPSFAVVAVAFGAVMAGGTLPTPLYPVWAREFNASALTITALYASYAVATVVTLVTCGSLSDAVGRRRILVCAVGTGVLSDVLFVIGGRLEILAGARVLAGMAVGLVTPAAAATLVDLETSGDSRRAATVATAATMLGLGSGPLMTGVAATWLPHPERLVFAVHSAMLMAALVAFVGISVSGTGAPIRLRARLGGPGRHLRAFGAGCGAAFAGFALQGFFSSLAPEFLGKSLGRTEPIFAGVLPFGLFLSAALAQSRGRRAAPLTALRVGLALLLGGLAGIGLASTGRSFVVFCVAALAAGAGSGLAFQAGLSVAAAVAAESRRADVAATVYAAGYAGLVVPVIGLGLVTDAMGSVGAALAYACAMSGIIAVTWTAASASVPGLGTADTTNRR